MAAPDTVKRLVERFEEHRDAYRSGRYNETQLRNEFLNPFFEALGWDVFNRQNHAEMYKDVIHEDSLEIEGENKAPDYAFRVGGTRKFFVEAKKPAVNIEFNIHPAFQLRRYAWSAKLPLSILTDFEEFAVYDCRVKPDKGDKASTGRVLLLSYRDYIEKWDEIAAIFSHEAVLKGSFDQYAEGMKTRKGTTEVDDAFLAEIERWRDLLARNIALRNPQLSVRELNFAVQMTIDRIVFLRICEDRGVERDEQLKEISEGRDIYRNLCQLFQRADTRYNSGLFHFKGEKEQSSAADTLTLGLKIDDKILQDILRNLYYPESPYVFKEIPSDILGQVYERFLGKVIRLTAGHQAKVEEKPEVRKAGGVYYTPTYIVDYIVQNTVGKLLEGKTPREAAKLKIVDPACGSGTFTLGAYQYLLDWHLKWYTGNDPEKWLTGRNPVIYQGNKDGYQLTTARKKEILLNNIFGVDIDPQAVEVTKLSLLLKVLEGENQETIGSQLSLLQERVLPDLGKNIQCGNSLIGPDYYEGQQLTMGFADEEERYRVNAFDWKAAFPQVFLQVGFDVVIGNPPYIRIQRIAYQDADYLYRVYKSPTSKADISLTFIEKALIIASRNGIIGFICTSQWLTTDYGKNLRQMLSDGRLQKIINFGSLPVFETAQTYPAIFILSPFLKDRLEVVRIDSKEDLSLQAINNASSIFIPTTSLGEKPWNLGFFDVIDSLNQKGLMWKPLSALGGAYIGALTGMDDAFVVTDDEIKKNDLENALLFPYAYRAGDIYKYSIVNPRAKVIYPYKEGKDGSPALISEYELENSHPNIFRYLLINREGLRKRMDSRKYYASGSDWYRYLRPGSYNYIRPDKLIIKGVDTHTTVGLLEANTMFNGANCPAIILDKSGSHSKLYLLGILNSTVVSYYLRVVCPPKLNNYRRFNANNLNAIPIRIIDFSTSADKERHDKVVSLVERMLELHKRTPRTPQEQEMVKREIESTDRQIDVLVYALYGLSPDEINIVEGKV